MGFYKVKECRSCGETYHKKELEPEEFEHMVQSDMPLDMNDEGDEFVVIHGCCKECEEEYHLSCNE